MSDLEVDAVPHLPKEKPRLWPFYEHRGLSHETREIIVGDRFYRFVRDAEYRVPAYDDKGQRLMRCDLPP